MTGHDEAKTFDQIMAALRELGSEFPIDSAVDVGLVGKDFYESPDACRYLLWNYEEHLAAKLGSGATVDELERRAIWKERASDSIEHIFPQNPAGEPAWNGKMHRDDGIEEPVERQVGRIGNLLLLPNVLNAQARIRPFEEKKKTYAKHKLRMVDEVIAEPDGILTSIERREKVITTWARTRWADL